MTSDKPKGPWYRYWARDEEAFHVEQPSDTPSGQASAAPTRAHGTATEGEDPAGGGLPHDLDETQGDPAVAESSPVPAPPPPDRKRYERATVLAVANQKGGVGKTTTSVSLAASLAELGLQVLLVDFDPQGNASSGLGNRARQGDPSIYDVLVDATPVRDTVVPTTQPGLNLIRATIDLAGAEVELVSAYSREHKLKRALDQLRDEYDAIIIDCPPSLGLLTVNAMTAADGVVVPIQCEYFALEGLGALRRNVDLIREQLNPQLEMTGFVLTMLDARTRLSQQVVDEVRAHFGDRVFKARIPRTVRLAEAPGFGQPITQFDPASRGAMAYRRLAQEVVERLDERASRAEGAVA